MSHFSEMLRGLIAKEDITQDRLAELSGVDRTLISRMLRERVPTRAQLAALCASISPDPKARAELLVAHLLDEAADTFKRAGLDKRHVVVEPAHDARVEEPAPSPFDSWPIQLRTEFVLIAQESLRTPEMRSMVSDLAALVERHAAERRKLYLKTKDRKTSSIESELDAAIAQELQKKKGDDVAARATGSESPPTGKV